MAPRRWPDRWHFSNSHRPQNPSLFQVNASHKANGGRYESSLLYQNDVAGTVLRAAHLRAHDILGEGKLVEALSERLEHESLTSQGHEVWRQAIFESELPEIRRAIDPLEPALTRRAASQVDQWSVVLDPAHSDGQPGATGPIPEADLTLAVARRARELLEQQGVAVVLTRDDDEARALTLDDDLAARAAFATEEHDAYITLHAATASDSTSRGVEVHISARQREEQRYLDSRNLAEAILQAVTDETGARERGLRESRTPQLELVEIPAVSLDLGFLSNQAEGERLASSEYQDQLARGLANGILAFLAQQQTESAAEHGLITPQELRRDLEERLSDDGPTNQSREVRSPAILTSQVLELTSRAEPPPLPPHAPLILAANTQAPAELNMFDRQARVGPDYLR